MFEMDSFWNTIFGSKQKKFYSEIAKKVWTVINLFLAFQGMYKESIFNPWIEYERQLFKLAWSTVRR